MNDQKLLISVKNPQEAHEADLGGAEIIDAEWPESALGTPYPLNIAAIRKITNPKKQVSTNIGEKQFKWSTAAQAALGVALAGVDVIKMGLADLNNRNAETIAKRVNQNVKNWFPTKKIIIAFFTDLDFKKYVNPLESYKIAKNANVEGILIDTFDKFKGTNLLDFVSYSEINRFTKKCHKLGLESWIAGSITKEQLPDFWKTGVDVICVRGAACEIKAGRTGNVKQKLVEKLIKTLPK